VPGLDNQTSRWLQSDAKTGHAQLITLLPHPGPHPTPRFPNELDKVADCHMGLLSGSRGAARLLPLLFALSHVYISLITADSRPAAHHSTAKSTAATHTYTGPRLLKPRAARRSFTIADHGDVFLKDQEPFRLISGSIHYHRWAAHAALGVGTAAAPTRVETSGCPAVGSAENLARVNCQAGRSLPYAQRQEHGTTYLHAPHHSTAVAHHHIHNTIWHPHTPPLPPQSHCMRAPCRIPPAYWEDRLARVKALGCNAIQMYVPWNWHQPTPEPLGPHSWTGWRNITHFIQMAGDMGLLVLLRPGPYVCAGEVGGAEGVRSDGRVSNRELQGRRHG
jgi:hypothetical protein